MKTYSLDELIEFVEAEIDTSQKIRSLFKEEPEDSLIMDEHLNKLAQTKEKLLNLKFIQED